MNDEMNKSLKNIYHNLNSLNSGSMEGQPRIIGGNTTRPRMFFENLINIIFLFLSIYFCRSFSLGLN